MTITTSPARNEYTSTAAQTVFNYTFKIYSSSDLDVYVTPAGQDANDQNDLTTDYVVDPTTIGDENGGFITFNSPINSGDLVTIVSGIPLDRTVDYQNNGDFRPDTVNGDNDRQVSQIKQVSEVFRSAVFPISQQNVSNVTLPAPEANKFLQWLPSLTGFKNVDASAFGSIDPVQKDQVIFWYNTVAEMKAATDSFLLPGQLVGTKGYHSAGDGGGAIYLVATPQTTDNVIDHTATNGNALLWQGSVIDAAQAGATGVNDDVAFSAIIARANSGPGVLQVKTNFTSHTFANGLLLDISKIKITGNTTTFDFSSSADTFCFQLESSETPPREQALSFLESIRILGDGKTGTQSALLMGVTSVAPAGPSRMSFNDIYIEACSKGIDIRNNTYLLKFFGGVIRDCEYGVTRPNGATNSGENISFYGTLFDGNDYDFYFDYTVGSGTDIYLHSCSLDDSVERIFHINAGVKITSFGAHYEHPSSNWAQSPFYVGDRNGLLVLNGGKITNPATGSNPPAILEVATRTSSAEKIGIVVNDVQTANLETSTGYLGAGDQGSISFKNRLFDGLDTSPNLIGEAANQMADGSFEDASITDRVYRLAGSTNVTLAVSGANPRTGVQSLAATHTGNPCKFVIVFPITQASTFKYEFWAAVTGGTVNGISSQFVLGELDSSGDFLVKKSVTAVSHGAFNNTSYTKIESNNQNQRAPSWANYAIIEFNADTFGGNTLYVDDVIANIY